MCMCYVISIYLQVVCPCNHRNVEYIDELVKTARENLKSMEGNESMCGKNTITGEMKSVVKLSKEFSCGDNKSLNK